MLGCKNNLLKLGANPAAYTSGAMSEDAKDILQVLGYPQADLYGISYGTRVAQVLMRDHPEMVRSAILNSVVPVEIQLFSEDMPIRMMRCAHCLRIVKLDSACSQPLIPIWKQFTTK